MRPWLLLVPRDTYVHLVSTASSCAVFLRHRLMALLVTQMRGLVHRM